MNKQIGIVFFIITVLALYDKAVSLTTEYNVNLDILYFGGWHVFAIGVCFIFASMRKKLIEKILFYLASVVFFTNLIQNVAVLNHSYYEFKSFVNNMYIDQLKWVLLIFMLSFFLIWAGTKFHRG